MKLTAGALTSTADFLPDLRMGLENLRVQKLRSLLTMLGMIFGVAAVVAMLSIGAGAQQEVMAFIEQLGVNNLIVEARESTDYQVVSKVRQLSAGLNFKDYRVIQANLEGIAASTPRKRFVPSKLLPRPQSDPPTVYGVTPAYVRIANLAIVTGRFFDEQETASAAPVAVLGEGAAASLFGADDSIVRHVKVNDQWFQVIGVAGPQLTIQTEVAGIPAQDRNNLIYVPLSAAIFRLEDATSRYRDEIDGIYVQMQPGADVPSAAALIRGLLNVAHRGAGDFNVVSPAELLAQQRRTQRIFEMVMVAIASIISMDTDIVIFDEPTTGQDALSVARLASVISELRKRGKTVITITHDIDFCAENFERVIAMSQGKILLDGKANDILGQDEILARTYVDPPQLTRLGKHLGFKETVRNQEEFLAALKK